MMFRVARKYDIATDSIVFANNQPFSADYYNKAGLGDAIENQLSFSRFMYNMKVDNAEYALLTAIVIFSSNYILLICAVLGTHPHTVFSFNSYFFSFTFR